MTYGANAAEGPVGHSRRLLFHAGHLDGDADGSRGREEGMVRLRTEVRRMSSSWRDCWMVVCCVVSREDCSTASDGLGACMRHRRCAASEKDRRGGLLPS